MKLSFSEWTIVISLILVGVVFFLQKMGILPDKWKDGIDSRLDGQALQLAALEQTLGMLLQSQGDMQLKCTEIHEKIMDKIGAARQERLLKLVEAHDKNVRELAEVHPHKTGERPKHWCNASTLDDKMELMADKLAKLDNRLVDRLQSDTKRDEKLIKVMHQMVTYFGGDEEDP